MRLAESTLRKRLSVPLPKLAVALATLFAVGTAAAQDNSPYSRYGLGDVVPNTNISTRAMGGIQAAYADFLSINFNNPASYSSFQSILEPRSGKSISGRAILDVGINLENRTLRSPSQPLKFTASNALFSYVQVGVPLRKNWGLSFGIRPVTRISYLIAQTRRLTDPRNGGFIDSAYTEYSGDGGSYLPSIGTGYAIKNFSIGVNVGYLFGKRASTTKRAILNSSDSYYNANTTTESSFGDLFFNAGAQYKIALDKKGTSLRLGVSGNISQTLSGSQDLLNETFIRDAQNGDYRQDSVKDIRNQKGDVVYPASYTAGFVLEHQDIKAESWLVGVDFVQTSWSDYRFFGATDAVKDNWQVRVGGQFRPKASRNYFSNVAYRAGFNFGPDYITVNGDLPTWGATLGLGLPLANYNRLTNQATIINLAMEYGRRGNNSNLLKENTFRISVGLNLSDLWFNKRKYE